MYTIAKTFAFSASHIIAGLPPEHPCGRLHGHNYEVEVILQAVALDGVGFVRDYRELSTLKDFLDATVDHNHSTTSSDWRKRRPKHFANGFTIGANPAGRKLLRCA